MVEKIGLSEYVFQVWICFLILLTSQHPELVLPFLSLQLSHIQTLFWAQACTIAGYGLSLQVILPTSSDVSWLRKENFFVVP